MLPRTLLAALWPALLGAAPLSTALLSTALLSTALLSTALLAIVPVLPAPLSAHPVLERERVSHHMKGPGPGSARRRPLTTVAVKIYLPTKEVEASGAGVSVFQGLLGFYRNVISPVDGNRCVMAPTCSLYSHQAIQEHGVIMGIFLTADRLLHEGDELPRTRKIKEGGEQLYLDTLEANTYWWTGWMK